MSVTGTAPRTQRLSSLPQVTGRGSGPGDAKAEGELRAQRGGQALKAVVGTLKRLI